MARLGGGGPLNVRNAVRAAEGAGFASLAIPLIGSGSWGLTPERSERAILEELEGMASGVEVMVVRYRGR